MSIKKPEIQESWLDAAEDFAEEKPKVKPKRKAKPAKPTNSNLPPEGFTRVIANVTLEQRRKLRMKAAMEDKSITDLISEWIDENC